MSALAAGELPDDELVEVPDTSGEEQPNGTGHPGLGRVVATVLLTALLVLGVGVVAAVTFLGPWGWALIGVVLVGLVLLFRAVGRKATKRGGGGLGDLLGLSAGKRGGREGGRGKSPRGGKSPGAGSLAASGRRSGKGKSGRFSALAPTASGRSARASWKASKARLGGASGSGRGGASGAGRKRVGSGALGRVGKTLGKALPKRGSGGASGGSKRLGLPRLGGASRKHPGGASGGRSSRLFGGGRGRLGSALGGGLRLGKKHGAGGGKRHPKSRIGRAVGGVLGAGMLPFAAATAIRARRAAKREEAEANGTTLPKRFHRIRKVGRGTRTAGRHTRATWRSSRGMRPKVALRAARMAMRRPGIGKKAAGALFGAGALGFTGAHKALRAGRNVARSGLRRAHNAARSGMSRVRKLVGKPALPALPALAALPRLRRRKTNLAVVRPIVSAPTPGTPAPAMPGDGGWVIHADDHTYVPGCGDTDCNDPTCPTRQPKTTAGTANANSGRPPRGRHSPSTWIPKVINGAGQKDPAVAAAETAADTRARIAAEAREEARAATGGPATGKGNPMFDNASDADGMLEYQRRLEHLSQEMEEMEAMARQFADHSESERPLNPGTVDAVGQIPVAVGMLREILSDAAETFARDHAADIERLENPRVNEQEWDASRND